MKTNSRKASARKLLKPPKTTSSRRPPEPVRGNNMRKDDQLKLLLKLHKLETNGVDIDKARAFSRLEKGLDPSLLRRYRKLKKRMGTGVAVLKSSTCSRCRMIYPESHEMMRYKNIIRECEYCGRLLVITDKSA